MRSEITSVSRVANVLLFRLVAGNMDVNTLASKRSQLIGTAAIVRKRGVIHKKSTCVCWRLSVAAFTQKRRDARVEQIILSGILPVFGNRIDGYRNSKRMAINGMVKRLCKEEDVGYVDLWDSVVGKEGMYARDGLHLSGKGAAVFAEGLSGAVASGLGKVRYLN